jgi:hypothetical protein
MAARNRDTMLVIDHLELQQPFGDPAAAWRNRPYITFRLRVDHPAARVDV